MKHRPTFAASLALAGLLLTTPALAQEARTDTLEITGAFARASAKMVKAGGGFMTIRSLGAADRLIAFRSPASTTHELHTHVNDNGMMRMREVEAIDVPAGGEAVLEPGGLHIMFVDLVGPLVEGESVPVTLVFEKAGEVEISVPIKGPGAMK